MGVYNLSDMSSKMDEQNNEVATSELDDGEVATNPDTGAVSGDGVKEPSEQMVTLRGPLSSIYSQALNMVYATESLTAGALVGMIVAKSGEGEIEPDLEDYSDKSFVYVSTLKGMDVRELFTATEALKDAVSKGYGFVALSLESEGVVNHNSNLLAKLCDDIGAHMFFSRSRAIDAITHMTKGSV